MAKRINIGLTVIRAGMGLLTRVVPPLGNRLAWSMFLRSPKPVGASQEDQYFLDTHGNVQVIEVAGHKVSVYSTQPLGPLRMRVLVLHGWGSRATALLGIGKRLSREGAEVIYYDGPGSGLTSKKQTTLVQMIEVVQMLQKEFGPFDVVIGHSFGSMAIAHAFEQNKLPSCKAIVSIGSPNSFQEMTARLFSQLWLPGHTMTYFGKKVKELTGREIQSFGIAVALGQIPEDRIRYLCIHDNGDKEVPVSDAHEIDRALDWAQVEFTTGLGHNRILKDALVHERIIEFVDETLYGLPAEGGSEPSVGTA